MDATLLRNIEQRYVTIQSVDMENSIISALDQYDQLIQISLDVHDPVVSIPAPTEHWRVRKQNSLWYLVGRAETGEETIPIDALKAGDKRVEAANDLYLVGSGTTHLLSPEDITIQSEANVNINGDQIMVNNVDLNATIQQAIDAAVVITPTASTRNVIKPSVDAIALTLKPATAGTQNVLELFNGSNVRVGFVGSNGNTNLTGTLTSGAVTAPTLALSGALSGATTINASGLITGGSFSGGVAGFGATTVTSLSAGAGTISGGATTVTTLNTSSLATMQSATVTGTTTLGTVNAGTLSAAGTTVTSLNAGSGAITTTGTLGAGAATVTSLNAGSGSITTTGQVNGATAVFTSTGAFTGAVTASQFNTASTAATALNLTGTTGTPGITIGSDTTVTRTAANTLTMSSGDKFVVAAVGLGFNDATTQTTAAKPTVTSTTISGLNSAIPSPVDGQVGILNLDEGPSPVYWNSSRSKWVSPVIRVPLVAGTITNSGSSGNETVLFYNSLNSPYWLKHYFPGDIWRTAGLNLELRMNIDFDWGATGTASSATVVPYLYGASSGSAPTTNGAGRFGGCIVTASAANVRVITRSAWSYSDNPLITGWNHNEFTVAANLTYTGSAGLNLYGCDMEYRWTS